MTCYRFLCLTVARAVLAGIGGFGWSGPAGFRALRGGDTLLITSGAFRYMGFFVCSVRSELRLFEFSSSMLLLVAFLSSSVTRFSAITSGTLYLLGVIDSGRDDIAGGYPCISVMDVGVGLAGVSETLVMSQKITLAIAIAMNAMWSICM